ncbi:hypothetical protein GU243_17690 [Pseudarthrobacter psychrotolerans]|uniref:Antibiotic biosynthesis monooxygenase n=1 Tax=Pseudarthrobacter psychrotolerans TaxID=2697569 RepID=A0A6P1NPY2_9MICC|nr:hypothetical protein [Pseudarthrobacter psychrotolerans]QHK21238.1 hypothetical protein GU243_17690 [Pseudarthrobacter psychrotolerans]
MAVAIIGDFTGGTLEQYDQILAKMNLTSGEQAPPGALFHWAAATESGIRFTDVWQTREQFDAFAQSQIGPFAAEVGLTEPPELTYYELHSYLTQGPNA